MARLRTPVLLVLVLAAGGAAAQERSLQPNAAVEATLRAGDSPHEYTFRAEAKQWVEVLVEQASATLTFDVRHPDGRTTWSALRESSTHRAAAFPTVAAGLYTVSVRVLPRTDTPGGKYAVKLTIRPQTATELARATLETELGDLDARWQNALGQDDLATLASLSHPDSTHRYSSEDLDGTVTHDQFFASAKRGAELKRKSDRRDSYSDRVQRVDVSGDVAVVTARFKETTSIGAKPYVYHVESVRVWGKDGIGWKVISAQRRMVGRHRHARTAAGYPSRDVVSQYVGTFRNDQMNREVQFAIEDDELVARWTFPFSTARPSPLVPVTDTTFDGFAKDEITFVRSPDGRVREFIQTWEGPAFLFVRVEEGNGSAPADRP